jgi:hypothetical protein
MRWQITLFVFLATCGVSACEVGKTVRLDLRDLEYPVVFNSDPRLDHSVPARWRPIAQFVGSVSESESYTSGSPGGYYAGGVYHPGVSTPPSHTQSTSNNVQMEASRVIGGRVGAAIVNLDVLVQTTDVFLLTGYETSASIEGSGAVVQATDGVEQ